MLKFLHKAGQLKGFKFYPLVKDMGLPQNQML